MLRQQQPHVHQAGLSALQPLDIRFRVDFVCKHSERQK
jgi:hypothetical protein